MANGYVCHFEKELGVHNVDVLRRGLCTFHVSELERFVISFDIRKISAALESIGFELNQNTSYRGEWNHREAGLEVWLRDAYVNVEERRFKGMYKASCANTLLEVKTSAGRKLTFAENPIRYARYATMMKYGFTEEFINTLTCDEDTWFTLTDEAQFSFNDKLDEFKENFNNNLDEAIEYATDRFIESYIEQLDFKIKNLLKVQKRAVKQKMQREIGDETADYLNDQVVARKNTSSSVDTKSTSQVKMVNYWCFTFTKKYIACPDTDHPWEAEANFILHVGQRLNGSYWMQLTDRSHYYYESDWERIVDASRISELFDTLDTVSYSSVTGFVGKINNYKYLRDYSKAEIYGKF